MIGADVVALRFVAATRLEADPVLDQGNGLECDLGLVDPLVESSLS
jgi:hypothetical protein